MQRFLLASVVFLAAALAWADGTEYLVYRASVKTPYEYAWSGSAWESYSGGGSALVLLDMTVDRKAPVLNRMALVGFWTEGSGRYYSVETLASGVYFHDFGNGAGALIMTQSWKTAKNGGSGVEAAVLLCKFADAPPKSFKGTSLTVDPDEEISRSEVGLKLDTKLSASATEAAAAYPANPFGAATNAVIAAVEAMGYTPEPWHP
jgi:hypothetical protein